MLEYLVYRAVPWHTIYMSRKNQSRADNQQETLTGILRDYTSDTALCISKKLATLIGILYTDGCLSPHGVRSWRIYFANTSWQAIKLFKQCLVDCFDISPARICTKQRTQNGHNIFCAILTSKGVGEVLTKQFGTFRTLRFHDGSYPKTQSGP